MKGIISALAVGILACAASVAVLADGISIEINGSVLKSEVSPQIVEGRTLVPVRAIFEGIGANVNWDANTKTITGSMGDDSVVMVVNSNELSINGESTTMDSSPLIIDGRTYAPARYVAESFGYDVEWDSASKTVKITNGEAKTTEATTEQTTETTTEQTTTEATTTTVTETTTKIYEKYSEHYTGKELLVGSAVPSGVYCVIPAKENGIAYFSSYTYGGSNQSGKSYYYTSTADSVDVVYLAENLYVDVSNGALVPNDLVEKQTPDRNGTFRVGTDISAGHYTFKLAEGCKTAYIQTRNLAQNLDKKVYRLYEDGDEQITLKLESGTVVKLYGVEILDSSLRNVGGYTPLTDVDTTAFDKYNFEEVGETFKTKINKELLEEIKAFEGSSKSSNRFTKSYKEDKISSWKSAASNSSEKKYAELAADIYNKYYNQVNGSKPELTKYDNVVLYGETMSSSKYKKILVSERDNIYNFALKFTNASSFTECEAQRLNVLTFYANVVRGEGYGKNN